MSLKEKLKFVALKSMGKSEKTKAFQVEEEEDSEEDSEEEGELYILSRGFNQH